MVTAVALCSRTIFSTYPQNYFFPKQAFPIATPLAVLLGGTLFHVFSAWFRTRWFSYIGFTAVAFGAIHSWQVMADQGFAPAGTLPVAILLTLLYCEAVGLIAEKLLPEKLGGLIRTPSKHLKLVAVWGLALSGYWLYSAYYVPFYGKSVPLHGNAVPIFWLPLLTYLGLNAGWLLWRENSWLHGVPFYFVLWQCVTAFATGGADLPDILANPTGFLLGTALMVLVIGTSFFLWEHIVSGERFRALSSLLWLSLIPLMLFSTLATALFYRASGWPFLTVQIALWAISSFIIGRFLNIGPLWLWAAFLLHLPALPLLDAYADAAGISRAYLSLHPFMLSLLALFWAFISFVTAKADWLYTHKHTWGWGGIKALRPPWLLAALAGLIMICVFGQAVRPAYVHAWPTVAGLFLTTLSVLLMPRQQVVCRHLLFGIPYTAAWIAFMLAAQTHYPGNQWFTAVGTLLLIGLGLFGALATLRLSGLLLPCDDVAYRIFQQLAASGILVLVVGAYLNIRSINHVAWPALILSGVLTIGVGLYFRYVVMIKKEAVS
jgi:hypothetical protein